MSQAVKTPRASPCEPLVCARRADGERVHGKELIKPPCPLRAQRFDGMKHTPRVMIPPMQKCKNNTVCREKNPLKASRRNISFLCYKWKISLLRILFPNKRRIFLYGSFITSVGGGQHRICLVCGEAAALPNALGGQSPPHRFERFCKFLPLPPAGRSPFDPLFRD